jgi:phosphatidylethanolamine/phosphatidyl-N-methylethanolamine N-methyltransferase
MVNPANGRSDAAPANLSLAASGGKRSTQVHPFSDAVGFFRAWVRDPLRVAAITPSGKALARLITAGINERTGPVIELGPGTGVFTRALLARGVSPEDLVLVETGADFAEALRLRFPAARTLCMDAARLQKHAPFGERPVGAVVSGLPVLSMPPRQVLAVLKGSFGRMVQGGAFYQFTYGPRCPVRPEILERLGLRAERAGRTLANIPPATVYRITRKDAPPPILKGPPAVETARSEIGRDDLIVGRHHRPELYVRLLPRTQSRHADFACLWAKTGPRLWRSMSGVFSKVSASG